MISFLLKRLGSGIILIVIVTAITFFVTYGAGIPVAQNILGPTATREQVAELNVELGLDRPVLEQYVNWVSDVIRGDLGTSYFSTEPVATALANRLPVTLSVVAVAAILTLLVSVVLGVASAVRRGPLDMALQSISTIAYVFPAIILGIVLVYVFAITLGWVPAVGYTSLGESSSGWFASVILPAVVLAITGIAALASQVRGALIDELQRDYVRTLRSRGVSETSIVLKHALRNAASPGLTTFSLQFISMFGGAFFIERIFALPGYGTYAYAATVQGDLPALLGVTLVTVLIVVVVNLLVDLATGWLNPKARQV